MDDRELMLFILYRMIGLQSELGVIRELVLRQSEPEDAAQLSKIYAESLQSAVDSYERDVHAFRQKQNLEGN